MTNRTSRLAVSIPTASADGRFYGRYPFGNAPLLSGSLADISNATGVLANANAAADWLARSTEANVVWAMNFDSHYEVDQFRYQNISGLSVLSPTGAGTGVDWTADAPPGGGGSLLLTMPTGGNHDGNFWQRPMAALTRGQPVGGGIGNGKTSDDPGVGGLVTRYPWDSSVTSTGYNWRKGYYAHPATQSQYPQWPVGVSGVYDGSTFFLCMAIKIGATRWQPAPNQNPPGKLLFIDITGQTSSGEILVRSANNPDSGFAGSTGYTFARTMPYTMYTGQGSQPNSYLNSNQAAQSWTDGGTTEGGSPWATTCILDGNFSSGALSRAGNCWEFPSGDWTYLLWQVIVGQDNNPYYGTHLGQTSDTWPFHDQTINVWKCDRGENAWTPLSLKSDYAFTFGSAPQSGQNGPNGNWNAPGYDGITCHNYINGQVARVGWPVQYGQIIFSHGPIAAPQFFI